MKKIMIKREPEVIEEIPKEKLCEVEWRYTGNLVVNGRRIHFAQKKEGEFAEKAIYLPNSFDWTLGKDPLGEICLVPLRKCREAFQYVDES